MNRREFLKGGLAALAALFVPKQEEDPYEWRWVDGTPFDSIDECDTLPECEDCQVFVDDRVCTYPLEKCLYSSEYCGDCPYFTDENIPATEWETLYARDLGKATLTDEEKRDAILDALCRDLARISARCEDDDWKPDL